MAKIMFNERYGLQSAVFEGRKTQTRREMFYCGFELSGVLNKNGKLECYSEYNENPIHTSRFAIGEIVAIAQSYSEIADEMKDAIDVEELGRFYVKPFADTKGWNNKMFVRADLMPHHIKITDIRCERLQEISDDDCLKEGIFWGMVSPFATAFKAEIEDKIKNVCYLYNSPIGAFRTLIGKLNGKEFWDTNPYVIVYEFEKID